MNGHTRSRASGRCSELRRHARLLLAIVLVAVGCRGTGGPGSGRAGGDTAGGSTLDLSTIDVCQRVPGKAVAEALGGQLADTLAFRASADQPSRCRYSIGSSDSARSMRQAYVVLLLPPRDFETRRMQQQNPVESIPGLGDAAYVTYAPAGERTDLYVLKRGKAAIQVTGENRAALVKIAKVAVAHL